MPEAKFALCFIFKVASEQMVDLFNDGNHRPCDHNGWMVSQPSRLGVDWSTVTRKNMWSFGILIREPLDRYLSAFLNKCNPLQVAWGRDKNCAGPPWPKGASVE